MSHRPRKVADQVRRELADLLTHEISDPRLGFVTVTEVRMSRDLHYARVWISALGDEEARRESMRAVRRAGNFLRREVAARLRLREAPELRFEVDETLDASDRLEQLLAENPVREVDVPAEETAAEDVDD